MSRAACDAPTVRSYGRAMTSRWIRGGLLRFAVCGVLATAAVTAVTASPAAAAPAVQPDRVIRQLITVTAASATATSATFVAYRRVRGQWVRKFGPWTARVGYNGIAGPGGKREGDGRTPSGTYGFSFFFGVLANPGVAFRFRHAYSYDVWDDDPASPLYNEWVDERTGDPGAGPEPMHQTPAYRYAAVIAYNTARTPGRGSAIFLHVGTGSATAGCVSLPVRELLDVLRWLKPARSPRIRIRAR
jgi:L,D-peptidoglycan transpeptidase YkuD (ErfK/YbiS/YcfS/YnhG family)